MIHKRSYATIEEADAYREYLVTEMMRIQQDLGEKNRVHADGSRWTAIEYHDWRDRAKRALNVATIEARTVKAWLKAARRASDARDAGVDAGDPVALLRAACVLFRRLGAEGVDFEPDEVALRNAMQHYVDSNGQTDGGGA
jgi:hypothetical protein